MIRIALATLTELVDGLGVQDQLREMLLKRARQDADAEGHEHPQSQRSNLETKISILESQLKTVQRNLAFEEDTDLREAIREEFLKVKAEMTVLKDRHALLVSATVTSIANPLAEVNAAMHLLKEIRLVSENPHAREKIRPLLESLGLRIGLRFVESIKGEKRRVRRLAGGILVFGDRMDLLKSQTIPHQDGSPTGDIQADNRLTYQTASKRLQNESTISRYIQQSVFAGESNKRPREGISSTKVSRGDCPSFEPLLEQIVAVFLQPQPEIEQYKHLYQNNLRFYHPRSLAPRESQLALI